MANGISQKEYDAYTTTKIYHSQHVLRQAMQPGSTFKTITGAIGLDAGTFQMKS